MDTERMQKISDLQLKLNKLNSYISKIQKHRSSCYLVVEFEDNDVSPIMVQGKFIEPDVEQFMNTYLSGLVELKFKLEKEWESL